MTPELKPLPSRIVEEAFSSPVDLFDFFFENHFTLLHYLVLYLLFTLIGVVSKFLSNFLLIQFPSENPPAKLTEGLLVTFIFYVIVILSIFFLESFVKNFLKHIGKQYKRYSIFISFLPLAATSIFFIFPKPFFTIGLIFGLGVGIYNLYKGFKYIYELDQKQLISFLFAIGIFIGALSFLLLFTFNLYKNWT